MFRCLDGFNDKVWRRTLKSTWLRVGKVFGSVPRGDTSSHCFQFKGQMLSKSSLKKRSVTTSGIGFLAQGQVDTSDGFHDLFA